MRLITIRVCFQRVDRDVQTPTNFKVAKPRTPKIASCQELPRSSTSTLPTTVTMVWSRIFLKWNKDNYSRNSIEIYYWFSLFSFLCLVPISANSSVAYSVRINLFHGSVVVPIIIKRRFVVRTPTDRYPPFFSSFFFTPCFFGNCEPTTNVPECTYIAWRLDYEDCGLGTRLRFRFRLRCQVE